VDDYGSNMFGGDDGAGNGNENNSTGGQDDPCSEVRPAQFVPFDPHRMPTEQDLIMAMTDAGRDRGAMIYFDQNFLKNWAGLKHQKLRKVIQKCEFFSFLVSLPLMCG
jgi:condensin complex subunit 2